MKIRVKPTFRQISPDRIIWLGIGIIPIGFRAGVNANLITSVFPGHHSLLAGCIPIGGLLLSGDFKALSRRRLRCIVGMWIRRIWAKTRLR